MCCAPDLLSRLKIASMEASRDEAKKRYRQHQRNYVDLSLGRPLEKLSVSAHVWGGHVYNNYIAFHNN